ncbi:MAG: hypothetical protein HUU50_02475 [Candidatus Brocadiae bacterium]|nr:hypothetical protein [Candidatus Brocadiia bacterium]
MESNKTGKAKILDHVASMKEKAISEIEQEAKSLYWDVYGKAVEWKNYQGLQMPDWSALPEKIRAAWMEVAKDKINALEKLKDNVYQAIQIS